MSSTVLSWFKSEVFIWRTIAASCWAMLFAPVMAGAFVMMAEFSITHPVSWINNYVAVTFSLQFMLSAAVFSVMIATVAYFSLAHFSVVADVHKNRLCVMLGLLQWSRLPFFVACCLSGAVSSCCLLRLMGPQLNSLTYIVDSKDYTHIVLNEHHLFLVESGVFFAVCYYVSFFMQKRNYLHFPHIQRHKFCHMGKEISQLIYFNAVHSLKYTSIYYLIYLFFGGGSKMWIKQTFGIGEDDSKTSLTSIFGLLDISLFWLTYALCFSLTMVWAASSALIRIFHTQILQLDVQNVMEAKQGKGLGDAMSCNESPLLQHLAFLDFESLCSHSKARRQELLSLSQPGGHPRVWMTVSRTALHATRELTLRVQDANRLVMSRVAGKGAVGQGDSLQTSFASSSKSMMGESMNSSIVTQSTQPISKVRLSLNNIPFITHLTAENPDLSSRNLFAASQMHIWAVEGLSQIASWSYSEDKYGVVQGCLPTLVCAFVDLHEAIEKHFKCTSVMRRSQNDDSPDASLPHRLHSVTHTAIYRIVHTYRKHLDDLHISPEYLKKLQAFSDFLV